MVCLEAKGLKKSFGEKKVQVINGIDLKINQGEFVSITGRSGSGKSTLLYLLSGLDNLTDGNILIDNRDFTAFSSEEMHHFRNNDMGFVFQFHYLLPELTSIENILMPARKAGKHFELQTEAENLLKSFDLLHCRDKKPAQMSGGEQQRVSLARALVMKPRFIFADEPTGNLDSTNGSIVLDIFEKVNEDKNTTILMVTHEKDFAKRADREIFLVDGRIEYEKSHN